MCCHFWETSVGGKGKCNVQHFVLLPRGACLNSLVQCVPSSNGVHNVTQAYRGREGEQQTLGSLHPTRPDFDNLRYRPTTFPSNPRATPALIFSFACHSPSPRTVSQSVNQYKATLEASRLCCCRRRRLRYTCTCRGTSKEHTLGWIHLPTLTLCSLALKLTLIVFFTASKQKKRQSLIHSWRNWSAANLLYIDTTCPI